jgi:hypothetical protein
MAPRHRHRRAGLASCPMRIRDVHGPDLHSADAPSSMGRTIRSREQPYGESVAAERIDAHMYRFTSKMGGRVNTTQNLVVSADGKTRTSTTQGDRRQGAAGRQRRALRKVVRAQPSGWAGSTRLPAFCCTLAIRLRHRSPAPRRFGGVESDGRQLQGEDDERRRAHGDRARVPH